MEQIELCLASRPESVGAARRAVTELDEIRGEEALNVSLLVSEVVTNSIRHAGRAPSGEIRLRARIAGHVLRVEVRDQGPGFERRRPRARLDSSDPGGLGLVLVDRLADRWGVERDGETCVWFELERTHAAASGG